MENKEIYLDNSATTKVYDQVIEVVGEIMGKTYGNPSSLHNKGFEAEKALKEAIDIIAANLKCKEKEILFTSGGTESDNLALLGVASAYRRSGSHIITTAIEHPAILECTKYMEKNGYEVTYLPVDEFGIVSLESLKNAIRPDTILVSIMHTNNEVGSVQPIKEASKIIKASNPNTLFHTDAVQGYGKYRLIPKNLGIDLMSVSGHKIHAPKGIGFLYIRDGVKINPIIFGGGQQRGLRSGTENVPGIVGLGKAIDLIYKNLDNEKEKLYSLKEQLIDGLHNIEDVKINTLTDVRQSAPHIVNASFPGIRSEVLLHALEDKGIYLSSGSACASHKNTASDTLSAMGLKDEMIESALRFSMSGFTTKDDIEYTISALKELVVALRKYKRH